MNLKDISPKETPKRMNRVMESRFGYAIDYSNLSLEKAINLTLKLDENIGRIRKSFGIHTTEKNPKYLELLMVRESLNSWIEQRQLNEGEMGKSEAILAAKDMVDSVQDMITDASKMLNEDFRNNLQPDMTNWNGYEVTFYVNPGATDIRSINPYAAYNLTHNEWTVFPSQEGAPHHAAWEEFAKRDADKAKDIVGRYSKALAGLQSATNPASRRNAEFMLESFLIQASLLYRDIHESRRYAFRKDGSGYSDFYKKDLKVSS